MPSQFFSLNKKTALERARFLAKTKGYMKGKRVRLSKTQIPHILNWKTWEYY